MLLNFQRDPPPPPTPPPPPFPLYPAAPFPFVFFFLLFAVGFCDSDYGEFRIHLAARPRPNR